MRDGQCVDAVFIRFRVEVVIGEFCTAAISGDNCGRPFSGVQRDHRAPEIAVLIKLGIGNMVFHIVLYIVLMIAVPVVPEACPVRILAFAGNPKLVLVRAEVVEIDLNAVSRLMRNQIGMWRQNKAHTGCECRVCGRERSRLILVFIKETIHDEKPSAGLSCLAAQKCLHKGVASGKLRIQCIQDIHLVCQIGALQHPAERGSLCSRQFTGQNGQCAVPAARLQEVVVLRCTVQSFSKVRREIAVRMIDGFDFILNLLARCRGICDHIAHCWDDRLLENPGCLIIDTGAVEGMLGVEYRAAIDVGLEHIHGKQRFREGINAAHVFIGGIHDRREELVVADFVPRPRIGQSAPVVCKATQPCAKCKASHRVIAAAGGTLRVDDKILMMLLRSLKQRIILKPFFHPVVCIVNVGQNQIDALGGEEFKVFCCQLCDGICISVMMVFGKDNALDAGIVIDQIVQPVHIDQIAERVDRNTAGHQCQVNVNALLLCDRNMVLIELLEIFLIASASPCVAEIVVGVKLDCRVRLEILWNQTPYAFHRIVALHRNAGNSGIIPPCRMLCICIQRHKQQRMLRIDQHTRRGCRLCGSNDNFCCSRLVVQLRKRNVQSGASRHFTGDGFLRLAVAGKTGNCVVFQCKSKIIAENYNTFSVHCHCKNTLRFPVSKANDTAGLQCDRGDGFVQIRAGVIRKGIDLDRSVALRLQANRVLFVFQSMQFQNRELIRIRAAVCISDRDQHVVNIDPCATIIAVHLTDPTEAGTGKGQTCSSAGSVIGLLRAAFVMICAGFIDPVSGVLDLAAVAVHIYPVSSRTASYGKRCRFGAARSGGRNGDGSSGCAGHGAAINGDFSVRRGCIADSLVCGVEVQPCL